MNLSFGERVRNLREDLDLNQTQLGKQTGMTQRKVSYLECGKYEPSVEDIAALCRFFHVSADYLIGLEPHLHYPGESDLSQSVEK